MIVKFSIDDLKAALHFVSQQLYHYFLKKKGILTARHKNTKIISEKKSRINRAIEMNVDNVIVNEPLAAYILFLSKVISVFLKKIKS